MFMKRKGKNLRIYYIIAVPYQSTEARWSAPQKIVPLVIGWKFMQRLHPWNSK